MYFIDKYLEAHMGILNEVKKTVKNIFNAEDDMMFDDENDFQDNGQQSGFSLPKTFSKKNGNSTSSFQNRSNEFNLGNHSFDMARNNQSQKTKSNGKIQVYVPKTFEEAFPIIKSVKSGFTAMVNVEIATQQVAQRLIDVISGAIYALDGDCKKMGEKQYIFSLSADTIGAMDYLPTNGASGMQSQAPNGFNFNMQAGYDMGAQPYSQPFVQNQGFGQNNGFSNQNFQPQNFGQQQGYNFGQNAEKLSQDLQNFYQPPKSQF